MLTNQAAQKTIRALANSEALIQLANALRSTADPEELLSTNRSRAVLRKAGLLDEALIHDFEARVSHESGLRLALYELLERYKPTGPLQRETLDSKTIEWLPLILAVYAAEHGYPLAQLDPESPPQPHTPAGLALREAVQFLRRQTRRSATERDRLARRLAFDHSSAPLLSDLPAGESSVPPIPPHFRSPVPVRYPEFNPPVGLTAEELEHSESPPPLAATRQAPLKITSEDLSQSTGTGRGIEITPEQLPQQTRSPRRSSQAPPSPPNTNSIGHALRQIFKSESLKKTRLRIIVQDYPDGPGLYGLQVMVTCRGIRSFVAGTTDRSGRFICELPVRSQSGLTYDVEVTWPRDQGGEKEQKAITLNADRTEFTLPFYRRLQQ